MGLNVDGLVVRRVIIAVKAHKKRRKHSGGSWLLFRQPTTMQEGLQVRTRDAGAS
jgi:hypothetical protein